MSHIRSIFEGIRKYNEDTQDVIKALIDTDFSASDEEKGKAAEMLKGLFFSDDPKAKELIKKLDKWFSSLETEVSEDDEDAPIFKTMLQVQNKLNQKSTTDKAGAYQYMAVKLLGFCDENGQIRERARKFLLEFMRGGFKKDAI